MVSSWVLVPVAVPALYLVYLDYIISHNVHRSTAQRSSKAIRRSLRPGTLSAEALPLSLPESVSGDEAAWILTRERVTSLPVPLAAIAYSPPGSNNNTDSDDEDEDEDQDQDEATALDGVPRPPRPAPKRDDGNAALVLAYARAVQAAFTRLPQAIIMRAMLEPERRPSLQPTTILGLRLRPGDLVSGVYRVAYRDARRVEYLMDQPRALTGMPPVRGLVVAMVDVGPTHVTFVNETWMWRKANEKSTLIESWFGGWVHGLTVSWLVTKGVEAVMV